MEINDMLKINTKEIVMGVTVYAYETKLCSL